MLAVRVSAKQFDLAYTLARASRVSMGEYVRRALRAATTRDLQ